MVELSFKQKLILLSGSIGIVAAVYLGVKYLFPIAAPFLIAYLIALLIEEPVKWLAGKLGGRIMPAAVILVFLLTVLIGGTFGYLAYLGINEVKHFIKDYDYYIICVQQSASVICSNFDGWLGFEDGACFRFLCDCTDNFAKSMTDAGNSQMVGRVMSLSLPFAVSVIKIVGCVIVSTMSIVYLSGMLTKVRQWREKSCFHTEAVLLSDSLKKLINVYFKVQALILVINCLICIAGLMIVQNPYAVVIGVLIGVVDALPIFGTGTILLPWALFLLVSKDFTGAAVMVTMYLITYFVREIMESKCMGDKMGIAPFTMLMVIFVGLMVYGILGFILGPVSYCIIRTLILYLKTVVERGKLNDV